MNLSLQILEINLTARRLDKESQNDDAIQHDPGVHLP